ncbi:MAG: hypothetical protein CMJ59_24460 [Planctomycetaceae bacterium]|nr:hypothetical protein [Planctomycetaceae bacterium]
MPDFARLTRRRLLQTGSLASLALGNAQLLRARDASGTDGRAARNTSVILVWLTGGLSHMDTYDPKPTAPTEYRGEFLPIRSSVPGMDLSDLLPKHAKIADRFALLRSLTHGFAGHDGAHKRVLTGRIPKTPTGFVNDAPGVGSIVHKMRSPGPPGVLPFTSGQRGGTNVDAYSQGSAYLGQTSTPFLVLGDPSQQDWSIPNLSILPEITPRLRDRRSLLVRFDQLRHQLDQTGVMESSDRFQQQAFSLLTSDRARKAFDLTREDDQLRQRYGMNPYGQQALLARRLIEAGTSFANVVMEHPGGQPPRNVVYNWDCHAVNCHVFDDARWRVPYFDQAISALITDLYDRGLDRDVLLVVTGEFGHTPRISYQKGTNTGVVQPGRDHWPGVYSALLSGGGLRTGQVIGSSNTLGERPADRPLSPDDIWATVYRHLGISTEQTFPNLSGRPMPILPQGKPIRELL